MTDDRDNETKPASEVAGGPVPEAKVAAKSFAPLDNVTGGKRLGRFRLDRVIGQRGASKREPRARRAPHALR